MKLSSICFAGFRGARARVLLDLASGFVVVTGRNGSGKSTVCDAIEYALTGSIRGSSEHSEKGEGLHNYVWWRGDGNVPDRFVEISLVGDDGAQFVVRRTPSQLSITPAKPLTELLCHHSTSHEDPIRQVCRTAILRDEEITRLSVDLKEADRFEFVRGALGTADFTSAEERAREVHEVLNLESERANAGYATASARVADLTARLSRERTELNAVGDVAAAEESLRSILHADHGDLTVLTTLSERRSAELRLQIDALTRLFIRAKGVEEKRSKLALADRVLEVQRAQTALEDGTKALAAVEADASRVREALEEAKLGDPHNASLAALSEHGQRLGLLDGRCPLCGTAQSPEQFRDHVVALSHRVAESSAALAGLNKKAAEVSEKIARARVDVDRLSTAVERLRQEESLIQVEAETIETEASRLGVGDATLPLQRRIEAGIEGRRREAAQIEQSLSLIQASRRVDAVRSLEQDVNAARADVVAADKHMSRVRGAANKAKNAVDMVRRVRGEFIDEQLAQLEPLLLELFQRLRPHIDWPEVRYRLRGDVRRMLSFEIGNGLNPSFMFSSGQRRAAGLAFLLAVHLSRRWCALKTLVLDDPVQHIDDYRALHLTEVLSAIRRTGQQVICTVEDESLANLLARRLRSEGASSGMVVHMGYSSASGIEVQASTLIPSFPKNMLVTA